MLVAQRGSGPARLLVVGCAEGTLEAISLLVMSSQTSLSKAEAENSACSVRPRGECQGRTPRVAPITAEHRRSGLVAGLPSGQVCGVFGTVFPRPFPAQLDSPDVLRCWDCKLMPLPGWLWALRI